MIINNLRLVIINSLTLLPALPGKAYVSNMSYCIFFKRKRTFVRFLYLVLLLTLFLGNYFILSDDTDDTDTKSNEQRATKTKKGAKKTESVPDEPDQPEEEVEYKLEDLRPHPQKVSASISDEILRFREKRFKAYQVR